MLRSIRHAVRLAFVAFALPIFGCGFAWLTVKIPDFNSKHIAGVWIWRLSPQINKYGRYSLIRFENVTTLPSGDVLNYTAISSQGHLLLSASLAHNTQDSVTVTLSFAEGSPPGTFKVSTFNASGESPLSAQSKTM
jgi:hypothetical protein